MNILWFGFAFLILAQKKKWNEASSQALLLFKVPGTDFGLWVWHCSILHETRGGDGGEGGGGAHCQGPASSPSPRLPRIPSV